MEDTAHLFDMACNMNKCKYEYLQQTAEIPARYTTICISLHTIVKTYIRLRSTYGVGNDLERMSPWELASKIFDLICHYKSFYANKIENTDKIFVFMYYSSKCIEYSSTKYNTIVSMDGPLSEYTQTESSIFLEAMSIIKSVIIYIPYLYLVDTENLPPAILPMAIASRTSMSAMATGANQRFIVVSGNELDYSAIAVATSNNSRGYIFRRSYAMIFTVYNLYQFLLLKNRVSPPAKIMQVDNYPYFLAYYWSNTNIQCKHNIPITYRRKCIDKYLFSTDFSDNTIPVPGDPDIVNQLIENLAVTDIGNLFIESGSIVEAKRIEWFHDRIDYSIEMMNDNVFKMCKVDFKTLFLGV